MTETINIFWSRRDLRLDDNVGLYHALKSEHPVLPIFIFVAAHFLVRTISLFVDGSYPEVIASMVIEVVVLLALYGLYRLRNENQII